MTWESCRTPRRFPPTPGEETPLLALASADGTLRLFRGGATPEAPGPKLAMITGVCKINALPPTAGDLPMGSRTGCRARDLTNPTSLGPTRRRPAATSRGARSSRTWPGVPGGRAAWPRSRRTAPRTGWRRRAERGTPNSPQPEGPGKRGQLRTAALFFDAIGLGIRNRD